jgi:hypothetical protein
MIVWMIIRMIKAHPTENRMARQADWRTPRSCLTLLWLSTRRLEHQQVPVPPGQGDLVTLAQEPKMPPEQDDRPRHRRYGLPGRAAASDLPASTRVPTFGDQQITLGDLASHAGGLPRDPKGTLRRWLGDPRNPYAALSVEELYADLARTRLRHRHGEHLKYSNLGAGLLGEALARAAGRPYETLVRERICLPLSMPDTVITPTGEQAARLATGHTRRGRPVPPLQLPALAEAGALRSTAIDMLSFLRANLDPAGTSLASQLEHIQLPRLRAARRVEVGLGWLLAHPQGCRPRAVAQRRDQRLS